MGTNCATLVADFCFYCFERDFMDSIMKIKLMLSRLLIRLPGRYLDDLLNIDNFYFEGMVNQIYPPELQLNKANITDTEALFLDLHLLLQTGLLLLKSMIKAMTLILI